MSTNTPLKIIVHHTGGTDANPLFDTSNQTFDIVNADHKVKFNMKSMLGYYMGYHYFIDKAGVLRQARMDNEEGAHTVGQNTSSIGICLAGNFDVTEPTLAQKNTLQRLLNEKTKLYTIPSTHIFAHRAFATKSCYGNKLADDWARKLVGLTREERIAKATALLAEAVSLLAGI